jgi:integrase
MALLTSENLYQATVTDNTTKKSRQVTMLQYKRSKTKGEFDIQITPPIQKELDWFKANTVLFEDYLLPIISVKTTPEKLNDYLHQIRKRFNRSLKALAEEVGLPESQRKLSIYSARHSFAMTMKDKGKSVDIISQALGHQSVETTKHYLAKFSTTRMAEETEIDLFEE